MYNNTQAFTLIELLVVVLIIGILAAVALPQYRLSVDRARLANMFPMARAVGQAQETFYLANATYTTDWNALDISLEGNIVGSKLTTPNGETLTLTIRIVEDTGSADAVVITNELLPDIKIYYFYEHEKVWPSGKFACYAKKSSDQANRLCQTAGHTKNKLSSSGSGDNTYYVYQL